MRILPIAGPAVLAVLIGLGVGYYLWGQKAEDLGRQIERQRSEYEFRISELERSTKAAEERARQEAEARRVVEDQLHRVQPQK